MQSGGVVTFQVGGAAAVRQPGPGIPALQPAVVGGALVPPRGPLDHHEVGRAAVLQQSPGQGGAGSVDQLHAEGAQAATCNGTGGRGTHILDSSTSTNTLEVLF